MPDPMHQHALRRSGELLEAGVAGVPIRAAKFHLDEFMVGEGALGLGDDRRGDPVLADEDDGIERVPEPAKILALPFRKFHRRIVKIAGARAQVEKQRYGGCGGIAPTRSSSALR